MISFGENNELYGILDESSVKMFQSRKEWKGEKFLKFFINLKCEAAYGNVGIR